MKEQVLKFEKFIQENDAKRHRAELKIKHERKYVNGTASHDDGPCQHEDVAADVSVVRTRMFDIKEKEHQQQLELQKLTEQEKAKLMSELGEVHSPP